MKDKDWFKLKRYPHIGFPLKARDRYVWIENYVTNPDKISSHAFLPFIHKTSKKRKFRKEYSEKTGKAIIDSKSNKALRKASIKDRELYYASHLDSLIYSYYAEQLSNKYEVLIKQNDLEEAILAYRSIPINPVTQAGPNKCNIDFANDAFDYIRNYPKDKFLVIALDIKSFFDELDHKILREIWLKLLNVDETQYGCLPQDHFNVYKNITRFSYVDLVDIFNEFQDKIFVQKRNKSGQFLPRKRKRISKVKFLKNQNAIAFCTKKEFFKKKNKLVRNTKQTTTKEGDIVNKKFGIPQGSPISSILANAYMINFDTAINNLVKDDGIYRRYSDDMVVVCPIEMKVDLLKLIDDEIKKIKLKIQHSKTQIFHFERENKALICGQQFKNKINWNKNLIYLGFEFDGEITLLRSASISAFYRKMKRSVRRSKSFSKRGKNKGEIFKKRLMKKFSYKGAERRRKWLWDSSVNGFVKSDHYDWGNFLSYSKKASNNMSNNKINKQTKKSWNKLIAEIKKKN